ncbi:uncharacterized protein V1510DRAFT_363627 [Dipodascopsis tothii]|uniref:uncharacterized protein n=1 Tax=Dipodascopsis tothii TaxID=44089 RepID=UPI0034CE8FB8
MAPPRTSTPHRKRRRSSTVSPYGSPFGSPYGGALAGGFAACGALGAGPRALTDADKRPRKDMAPLRPSYVCKPSEARPFLPGDHLGLHVYVPGATASLRVTVARCLRQTIGPTVFVFYGAADAHVQALSDMTHALRQQYDAAVFAVCVGGPDLANDYSMPIIMDTKTALTRYCRALDPNAGGRQAMAAVVVVDARERRRMFLPVGYGGYIARPVAPDLVPSVVTEALAYLAAE